VTASGAIYRLPAVVTRRLPPELLPSECPDGKTYLGDVGVTLATAAYVPKMLTPEMVRIYAMHKSNSLSLCVFEVESHGSNTKLPFFPRLL
jgi:hypothetical protein